MTASMTRQHFQLVAEVTGETLARLEHDLGESGISVTDSQAARVVKIASEALAATNGRFDRDRFEREVYRVARVWGWRAAPVSAGRAPVAALLARVG